MSTTSASFVLGVFNNVRLVNLNNGIDVGQNARASISNSTISGNIANGVLASNATAVINVSNSQIAFNELVGVNASVSGSLIRLSNNDIHNNSTGINIAGGATVQSAINNRVVGNGPSAPPNGTAIPTQ